MRVAGALALCLAAAPAQALTVRGDHALHALAGVTAYTATRGALGSPTQAMGVCVAAGIAKEAYDATGRGTPEASDVVATAIPCLVLWLVEQAGGGSVATRRHVPPAPVTPRERRDLIEWARERAKQ